MRSETAGSGADNPSFEFANSAAMQQINLSDDGEQLIRNGPNENVVIINGSRRDQAPSFQLLA